MDIGRLLCVTLDLYTHFCVQCVASGSAVAWYVLCRPIMSLVRCQSSMWLLLGLPAATSRTSPDSRSMNWTCVIRDASESFSIRSPWQRANRLGMERQSITHTPRSRRRDTLKHVTIDARLPSLVANIIWPLEWWVMFASWILVRDLDRFSTTSWLSLLRDGGRHTQTYMRREKHVTY